MKVSINDQAFSVDEPADTTVLQFVRRLGLTGTKEGCASGDCGACTVMVGEPDGDGIRYHTINSCIVPIGQMAGRHLVTVEGLEYTGALHPAQAEMVNCHGSQCGYCTPGFVMSLAALVEAGFLKHDLRELVVEGISGNLCRCTGYRPIIEAGIKALKCEFQTGLASTVAGGLEASYDPGLPLLQPDNKAELQAALTAHPGARLIAGGTDLMLEVTQRYQAYPTLIDLSRVVELIQIHETETHYEIGAAVPYTLLQEFFADKSSPLLQLLVRLGSRQIRNSGTIGGNLANGSPIADMPPVLMVWQAELELLNSQGLSRRVKVDDFYTGYRQTILAEDEYIATILVPKAEVLHFHRFYKSSKRIEDDISSVLGAFTFEGDGTRIDSARIAFGGMAATPVRLQEIESQLGNQLVSDELIAAVGKSIATAMTPLTDVRASANYRAAMAASMVTRALNEYRGDMLPLVTEVSLHA